VDALVDVERGKAFAREAVAARRASLADPRDRGLLTKLVFEVVRRRATLDALLEPWSRRPLAELDPRVRAALRLGLGQAVLFVPAPPWAAVAGAVEAAKAAAGPGAGGYVNAVLRNALRAVEGEATGPEDPLRDVPRPEAPALRFRRPVFPDPAADPAESLARRFAHPAWLVRRWLARHGPATTRAMVEAGASRPRVSLRARPGAREALLAELAVPGVVARAGEAPDEVVVEEGDTEALAPVRAGRAAVQDGTAQRVAPLADPRPGDRVLDLCAAPGGKTLHLLDLLGERGEVVAGDVVPARVEALAALLAARAPGGLSSRAVLLPREGALPFAPSSFDAVVVDAPCTNTGVLRRRLEARDRLREGDVAVLAALQRDLVARAWPLVRPGGRLVYSTCSVEPEEGSENAVAMAAAAPGSRLEPGFDVLPSTTHDGGFAAVLVRG
jgi:16S rRNA (cytosine967-C5)-methyltransferase